MGFSPGFFISNNVEVHFELRTDVIVLWNNDESQAIMRLTADEAKKALKHLELLVNMMDPE
jgi:hypothetical protein